MAIVFYPLPLLHGVAHDVKKNNMFGLSGTFPLGERTTFDVNENTPPSKYLSLKNEKNIMQSKGLFTLFMLDLYYYVKVCFAHVCLGATFELSGRENRAQNWTLASFECPDVFFTCVQNY
ncbi:hypothetical protein ACJX0J_023166 [Zea mays]